MRSQHEQTGMDAGFGLTELLVSLVLLALVSLLVLQGIGAGRNLWGRATARAQAAETIEGAQMMLRERLGHIVPVTRYAMSGAYSDIDGTASSLAFVAPPPAEAPGSFRRYILRLVPGNILLLTSYNDLWGFIPEMLNIPPKQEVVLRGVQAISIAYFDGSHGSGKWQASWSRRAELPSLVRFQVKFAAGDGRWWPSLMVHPIATVDTLCVLNLQTGRCGGRS